MRRGPNPNPNPNPNPSPNPNPNPNPTLTLGGSENLTSHYIFLLGMYRLFYLFNWVYRYATEEHYMQVIVWVSGIVQTALYLDFFYNYINAKRERIDAPIALDP